jgi:hypothetical protein
MKDYEARKAAGEVEVGKAPDGRTFLFIREGGQAAKTYLEASSVQAEIDRLTVEAEQQEADTLEPAVEIRARVAGFESMRNDLAAV